MISYGLLALVRYARIMVCELEDHDTRLTIKAVVGVVSPQSVLQNKRDRCKMQCDYFLF